CTNSFGRRTSGACDMEKTLELLARYESRNVTYMEEDRSWPIVWERARGMHVWDTSGKRYLDLTAAFGVANAGHANPRVVEAGRKQMRSLLHAMGDVHPHPLKAQLVQRLGQITFERWTKGRIEARTILSNSGFEAVEAALKTALLATGTSGVITFTGAYHGLGYGALNATHRQYFRGPFKSQLRQFGKPVQWPMDLNQTESEIKKLAATKKFGAILVEPIQARGGTNVPPAGFLKVLRQLCNRFGLLLILDEIYTGFGRTGAWFACEHEEVVPDLICLGKALSGGFPISACVGQADVMNRAWPRSHGEALHTSTFLGHPVGCAMALAQIEEIAKLIEPARKKGEFLKKLCPAMRGVGLIAGLDVASGATSMRAIKRLLRAGYIFLPEGNEGEVISFTPPLIISEAQIKESIEALQEALA
ncbi:MAG TPA: aspartate aminotransferase family protein, partial [Verrucomicrobiae bacterium]|nr:aspartate aminotransferase family protein [Verrucomicrobiae bacterium]